MNKTKVQKKVWKPKGTHLNENQVTLDLVSQEEETIKENENNGKKENEPKMDSRKPE